MKIEVIYINTKEIILDATIKLMKNNNINKLTVQKILDEANISRSTFYKFFSDKYDVINYYFKYYVDSMLNENCNQDLENKCAYQFLYDNKDYFLNAFKIEGQNSFKSFFYDYYYKSCAEVYLANMSKETLSDDDKIALECYCSGALHITEQWLMNGAKESPKHMAELTQKLIPKKYWKNLKKTIA